ncbi:MAG: bacillithiol biosynthesis deacetylase BshB1 [Bacteroidetes bacterium]|nr:bacillithiol biosynthesis deacetylase BshB1 [Bacteroidota bacterium]MDA0898350.1 bacillithiol biosynthesis deacetylase BshB1 [Bacteroidota bacterium]
MKLDVLAFGAHPDDVELGAGGILAVHAAKGKKVGIIDLTRGEMGTRGTPELRDLEAAEAARILGCVIRENLAFPDGIIPTNHSAQIKVAEVIRKYQPEVVLMNAPTDRHPDHGRASQLVEEACFLSGLHKLDVGTEFSGLLPWRPKQMYKYLQYYNLEPNLVVDITSGFEAKMAAVLAHKSQFYDPTSLEPETVIASKGFLDSVKARAMDWGRIIGAKYAEPLISVRHVGVENLLDLR